MVLLTGATGTFGQAFLHGFQGPVRAFSRDEFKQSELQPVFTDDVRWLLGDVRDLERLRRAVDGCDTVVHAAALKQVPACEYNPGECIKTNVLGSMNVVEACLDRGVKQAVLVSSDKAVHPVNVYGASKLCAEKLWLAANAYGGAQCKFSVVRYGNVKGSRGSILSKAAPVIRDSRATRFWMKPEDAVRLVLLALETMQGGEVYVPKLESGRVSDLVAFRAGVGHKWISDPDHPADWDGRKCEQCGLVISNAEWASRWGLQELCPEAPRPEEPGLLPGEKLHEQLISDEEVGRTFEYEDHYVIHPPGTQFWKSSQPTDVPWPQMLAPGFRYTSNA